MTEKMRVILPDEVKRAIWLRMLAMFLFVVAFCLLTSYWQQRQTDALRRAQHASYGNCLAIQSVVQLSVRNVTASTALSPEAKATALATDLQLLKGLDCADLKP